MLQNPCIEGQMWGAPGKSPHVLCSCGGPGLLWPQGEGYRDRSVSFGGPSGLFVPGAAAAPVWGKDILQTKSRRCLRGGSSCPLWGCSSPGERLRALALAPSPGAQTPRRTGCVSQRPRLPWAARGAESPGCLAAARMARSLWDAGRSCGKELQRRAAWSLSPGTWCRLQDTVPPPGTGDGFAAVTLCDTGIFNQRLISPAQLSSCPGSSRSL